MTAPLLTGVIAERFGLGAAMMLSACGLIGGGIFLAYAASNACSTKHPGDAGIAPFVLAPAHQIRAEPPSISAPEKLRISAGNPGLAIRSINIVTAASVMRRTGWRMVVSR